MANNVDPDGTARYESSHPDLHGLHGYWFWSARLKRFNQSPDNKKVKHLKHQGPVVQN